MVSKTNEERINIHAATDPKADQAKEVLYEGFKDGEFHRI